MTKKIGFIGPGKVGCSLGRYISEKSGEDFSVCGYFGRDMTAARDAAAFAGGRAFDSAEELANECDLLLLTVPDRQISEVWASLAKKLSSRYDPLYVGHCSGSQSAEIFDPRPPCSHFGSIHPLLAVYDKESSYKKFHGAFFTVEGDEIFMEFAKKLLFALDNPFSVIDAEKKTTYHAASVMVSNLVCALIYEGVKTFKSCGFEGEFANSAWRALFLENAENIASLGPVFALTGPVERGDTETVARHLEALSGDTREIYTLLSRTLTETAQMKNPERDYSDMMRLLESYKNENEKQ